MISERKKAELGRLNRLDRLSDLPDSVIHHVISFLGTKEACRTTILSKRWSNVWATSPVLNLQPQYFIKEELDVKHNFGLWEEHPEWFDEETNEKYLSFVETTMQKYSMNNLSIRKLKIKFPAVDHDLAPRIDKCLGIAVHNKVEELSLSIIIKGSFNYRLPAVLFSAKSLKSLSCSRVEMPYYEHSKLVSLQWLSLYDVTIEENVLQHIINSCPLDGLFLHRCYGLKSILIPHFSKLSKLDIWRRGETGGVINVESSNLVRLSYYCCDEKQEPSWPCKIHATLCNLRSLELWDAAISDETLAKLLPGLVQLEMLTLCSCYLLENICIYGTRLKELSLNDCYGLTSVTIDTPNLDTLCYTGDPNIMLVTTNIPARCKVYFSTEPETFITNWFIRLKKFLIESNIFRVLSVWMPRDISMVRFNEEKAGKISPAPPYKLGELKISLPTSVSERSSLSSFVDGLLWSCRPDQLSIPLTLMSGSMIALAFIELLQNRAECWWHPLRRIEASGADCSSLLCGGEVEFHIKLYW